MVASTAAVAPAVVVVVAEPFRPSPHGCCYSPHCGHFQYHVVDVTSPLVVVASTAVSLPLQREPFGRRRLHCRVVAVTVMVTVAFNTVSLLLQSPFVVVASTVVSLPLQNPFVVLITPTAVSLPLQKPFVGVASNAASLPLQGPRRGRLHRRVAAVAESFRRCHHRRVVIVAESSGHGRFPCRCRYGALSSPSLPPSCRSVAGAFRRGRFHCCITTATKAFRRRRLQHVSLLLQSSFVTFASAVSLRYRALSSQSLTVVSFRCRSLSSWSPPAVPLPLEAFRRGRLYRCIVAVAEAFRHGRRLHRRVGAVTESFRRGHLAASLLA